MSQVAKRKFHFQKHYGLFVGNLIDNVPHKHYAQQISVSNEYPMKLTLKDGLSYTTNSFFINSRVPHQLESEGTQLVLLINPLSSIGHQLHLQLSGNTHSLEEQELTNDLKVLLLGYEERNLSFQDFYSQVDNALMDYKCQCEEQQHVGDDRIIKAIRYLEENFEKVVSLNEVAEHCFLSPTRFLHLFKEKTNLNFRRYQLWNRLVKSLPYLMTNSMQDTAYTFGFSDSSHYARTFKESFGVTPKFLF